LSNDSTNTIRATRGRGAEIEASRIDIKGLAIEGETNGGDSIARNGVEALTDVRSLLGAWYGLVELSNIAIEWPISACKE
jgi:hypothetical protein